MSFLKKLLGISQPSELRSPFNVGDKVRDVWGSVHVVTEVDSTAKHGLGLIRTRSTNGHEMNQAFLGHGLELVDKDTPLASASHAKEKIRPDESVATAYLRAGRIFIHGVCQTNMGGFNCEPYESFDAAISNSVLGSKLLQILAASNKTPMPTDHKAEQQKTLKAFGVRSWSKLHENSACCNVTLKPKELSVMPTRNEGRTFFDLPDLTIHLPSDSSSEIVGKALRDGFQKCT